VLQPSALVRFIARVSVRQAGSNLPVVIACVGLIDEWH
jgi:hypothetical protein